jgi:hypothetical protein
MGAAVEQVVDVTNEEITTIWRFLNSFEFGDKLKQLTPSGHTGYFASYQESELDDFLDLLVLVFDTTVLPETWKDIGDQKKVSDRTLAYYDAGALLPLDQKGDLAQCVAMRERHKSDRPALGPMSRRIVNDGRYLDVAINPNEAGYDGTFVWARENLMKILTLLDSHNRGFEHSKASTGLIEQGLLPKDGDPVFYGMHLMNHLNGQIITSQLLGVPLVFGTVTRHVVEHKFGSRISAPSTDATHLLKQFTDSLGIALPKRTTPKQILKLRESDACTELRKVLAKCVAKAEGDGPAEELERFSGEYEDALKELNEQAKSFGDTSVAVLAGAFSTFGSVLGGPAGAVIGGIGGTAVSLAAKPAVQNLYRASRKNWAFYFYEWADKRKSHRI